MSRGKAVRSLLLGMLAAALYLHGVMCYGRIRELPAFPVFFSDTAPDRTAAGEILESERQTEDPVRACFRWDFGIQTVEDGGKVRRTQALAVGILGDAALYDGRANGLAGNDREGCVIDGGTAQELFGSRDAAGRTVILRGRSYQVRQVVFWEEPLILFHPEDTGTACTGVLIERREGSSGENIVSGFLMRHGFSGQMADGECLGVSALALLGLLPLGILFSLYRSVFCSKKEDTEPGMRYGLRLGIFILLAGISLWLLCRNIRISPDWLPGRWSDFSFFVNKMRAETERLKRYAMLPRTALQAENLRYTVRAGAEAAASFFLSEDARRRLARSGKRGPKNR